MSRHRIRWLLVEWMDGGALGVVNVRAVVSNLKIKELTTGKLVTISRRKGETVPAKIVMSSDDRKFLEQQVYAMSLHKAEDERHNGVEYYPQLYEDPEPGQSSQKNDYSPSGSSWVAWTSSESEDEMTVKKIKRENYKRKYSRNSQCRRRVPSLRLEPVVPNNWRFNESGKALGNTSIGQRASEITVQTITSQLNISDNSFTLPTTRRRVMTYDQQVQTENPCPPSQEDIEIIQEELQTCKKIIKEMTVALSEMAPMFNMINVLKSATGYSVNDVVSSSNNGVQIDTNCLPVEMIETRITEPSSTLRESTNNVPSPVPTNDDMVPQTVFNQSTPAPTDVGKEMPSSTKLVSSSNGRKKNTRATICSDSSSAEFEEVMIQLGTGKTLVAKSIYDEINWNSYTMATRKLLMAVFPRKVLATHSLTGKSSPAFMHKPPKLCLDPRKVSDIVITVAKNCNVKENLVRNAITTKCADENKMYKFQKIKERTKKPTNGFCDDRYDETRESRYSS